MRLCTGYSAQVRSENCHSNAAAACATWKAPALGRRPCWDVTLNVGGLRVHLGTAPFDAGAYTCYMQLVSIKAIIAMVWVLAVSIAGIAGNLNSFSSWTVLVGIAFLPPLVMMRQWNDPRQSMSQSAQEAVR